MQANGKNLITVDLFSTQFQLNGDATAYLPKHDSVLVSDLHLGKDTSFRKAGIPVPSNVTASILRDLDTVLQTTKPTRLAILGDLIHNEKSMSNELVAQVATFRQLHSNIEFILVLGNHDRWIEQFPEEWGLNIVQHLRLGNLNLVHDNNSMSFSEPTVSGHLHPVIWLGTRANRIRLPCFVANDNGLVLPAFGAFKGGSLQSLRDWTKVFPVCDGRIWMLKQ